MAARFSNLLWRFDLFLGGSIWIALLALAYSAGPIEKLYSGPASSLRCRLALDGYAAAF